jgi:hypothetical protein
LAEEGVVIHDQDGDFAHNSYLMSRNKPRKTVNITFWRNLLHPSNLRV